MKKVCKTVIAAILSLMLCFAPVSAGITGFIAHAATVSQLNVESVFLKQQTSVTCTLSSAATILRRTAIVAGYTDWAQITEENIRSSGWVDGLGLLWNFSCYNMTIGHGYFAGADNKEFMISLLNKYPQGVVIYNGGNGGQSHAIVLLDYDSEADIFYVCDPANSAPKGRIKMEESSIVGGSQSKQIDNLTSYWYVSSPSVKLENGEYSVTSSSSSTGSTTGGQSTYDPTSDSAVFESTKAEVNKYFVATDDASKGAALRYYPSGSSSAGGYATKGALIYITHSGKNNFGALWYKTNNGYYIFSGNVTSFEDYSAEIKKFNNTAKTLDATYKVSDEASGALRLEPSEGNNILATAPGGTLLYITASGVNSAGAAWLRTSEGYYIKEALTDLVSQGKAQGAGYSGTLKTLSGSYSASPVADEPTTAETQTEKYTTTAALNLRSSAVDGEVLLVIPNNTIITVYSVVSGWGRTEYGGKTGYVSMQYTAKADNTPELKPDSVTLSASEIELGDSVSCKASATGGSGDYKYKFVIYDDKGDQVLGGGSFQGATSATFSPASSGTYYFGVTVQDSTGAQATEYSGSFTVKGRAEIQSVMSDIEEYTYTYQPVSWIVHVSDSESGTVFLYSLYRDGELVTEAESSEAEFSYEPEVAGSYVLKASIKNNAAPAVDAVPVVVVNSLSINAIKLSAAAVPTGTEVGCLVSATGGTGEYTYCFSVFKDGKLMKNGSFSSSNGERYTFTQPGVYKFFCSVADSGNMIFSDFSAEIVVSDVIAGDVNGDGRVTSIDARLVLRYSAGLSELSEGEFAAADVNGDGNVTSADARIILRRSASLESS